MVNSHSIAKKKKLNLKQPYNIIFFLQFSIASLKIIGLIMRVLLESSNQLPSSRHLLMVIMVNISPQTVITQWILFDFIPFKLVTNLFLILVTFSINRRRQLLSLSSRINYYYYHTLIWKPNKIIYKYILCWLKIVHWLIFTDFYQLISGFIERDLYYVLALKDGGYVFSSVVYNAYSVCCQTFILTLHRIIFIRKTEIFITEWFSQGYTPCHIALQFGHEEIYKILVESYGKYNV